MRAIIQVICVVVGMLCGLCAHGQDVFFVEEEEDTLSADFYQRGHRATLLAQVALPRTQAGLVVLLHNSEDRISYLFNVRAKVNPREVIRGRECNGKGVRHKEVDCLNAALNIGFARAVTANWFAFITLGTVFKYTYFDNQVYDNYRYRVPDHGVWFNIEAGAMYVTNRNLSVMLGADFGERHVTLGLGYTL